MNMKVTLNNESVIAQAKHCEKLAYILGLTTEMLALADRGEWEKVASMEQDRREDLLECFSQSRPEGDTELVAQAMATLLHLNEELRGKLRAGRSEIMAQGEALSHGRAAHQSYQAVEATI